MNCTTNKDYSLCWGFKEVLEADKGDKNIQKWFLGKNISKLYINIYKPFDVLQK